MVVRIVAFAGDEFTPSVTIQIRQGQGMRLRPAIVNQMLRPHAISPGILFLLMPEDAVVVGQAGEKRPVAVPGVVTAWTEEGTGKKRNWSKASQFSTLKASTARLDGSLCSRQSPGTKFSLRRNGDGIHFAPSPKTS